MYPQCAYCRCTPDDYDTHDLRLSERGFFPALSRRQCDHRRTKTTTGSFARNGMRTFLQKARGKIGLRNNEHTRAVTRAGTMRR
jgi:hypothetical protein